MIEFDALSFDPVFTELAGGGAETETAVVHTCQVGPHSTSWLDVLVAALTGKDSESTDINARLPKYQLTGDWKVKSFAALVVAIATVPDAEKARVIDALIGATLSDADSDLRNACAFALNRLDGSEAVKLAYIKNKEKESDSDKEERLKKLFYTMSTIKSQG